MLYEIAHIIKDRFRFLWEFVESSNGCLFAIRYGNKLKGLNYIMSSLSSDYCIRQTNEGDIKSLVKFFEEQPEDAFKFFHPHEFDEKSIRKIIKNKAFQTFVVLEADKLQGYFFLRSYFNGKCFRGRMADYRTRGKGIGKLMAKAIEKIAVYEGLKMYASISLDNLASLNSAKAVSNVKILKVLDNGYYYIEVTPFENADNQYNKSGGGGN